MGLAVLRCHMERTIHIANDFSRFPGGRYRTDGRFSGQEFREDFLEPAFARDQHVTVILDGVAGLPASFLEEAFGGLVRAGYSRDTLERRLEIRTSTPRLGRYPAMIWEYIATAAGALQRAV
jgi:STAS-like domain of unknown function (DUF4325)